MERYNDKQQEIESYGFTKVTTDMIRPWDVFLVIKKEQAHNFADRFFDGLEYFNNAKALANELFVIVNNNH